MKALYCHAMGFFFKVVEGSHVFTDREFEHIANGDWLQVDLAEDFDGNLNHYSFDGSGMAILPESEWPENQIEEEEPEEWL
jgi:hypothetical protein